MMEPQISVPDARRVEPDGASGTDDTLQKEFRFEEEELRLRRTEARRAHRRLERNRWLTSPVLVAAVTAGLGILASGAAAVLEGVSSAMLERQKLEATLIRNALEAPSQKEAARRLKFLVTAGLIRGLSAERVSAAADSVESLPLYPGFAQASVAEVQERLRACGAYDGPITGTKDSATTAALRAFQASRHMAADDFVGPATISRLRECSGGA